MYDDEFNGVGGTYRVGADGKRTRVAEDAPSDPPQPVAPDLNPQSEIPNPTVVEG